MPLSQPDARRLQKGMKVISKEIDAQMLIPFLYDEGRGVLSRNDVAIIQAAREKGLNAELVELVEIYKRRSSDLNDIIGAFNESGFQHLGALLEDGSTESKPRTSLSEADGARISIKPEPLLPEKQKLSKIVLVGGHQSALSTEIFCPEDKSINGELDCQPSVERWGHTSAYINGKVLLAGGHQFISETEIFDPSTLTFSKGPPMTIGRSQSCAAVLQDCWFQFGGIGEISNEMLAPDAPKWVQIQSLKAKRWGGAAVAYDDVIMLLGGHVSGSGASNSAEIYNPRTKAPWHSAKPMSHRRSELAACQFNRCVTVSGGMDSSGLTLSSCERLDPRVGKWDKMKEMTRERSAHCMEECDGSLLVLGGCGKGYRAMNVVEKYDERMDSWLDTIEPLRRDRSCFSAVVVAVE